MCSKKDVKYCFGTQCPGSDIPQCMMGQCWEEHRLNLWKMLSVVGRRWSVTN